MNKKKVNVKVMEMLTIDEQQKLMEGLGKIDGFDFIVDVQYTV